MRLRDSAEERSAEEHVRDILGIPENYLVECIIGIGYSAEDREGHSRESLDWGKVHINKYG